METKFCVSHQAHQVQLICHEKAIQKLETKLWAIIVILITNLGGIIAILSIK